MENGFNDRVKRVFGGLLDVQNTSSSVPWEVTGRQAERRRWRKQDDTISRDDIPCASAFTSPFLSKASSSGVRFQMDEAEDVEVDARHMRSFVGLDSTLDHEDEEDEFDKVAIGKEDKSERTYMRGIMEVGRKINAHNVLPGSLDDLKYVSRDPRANHYAAKARLREDDNETSEKHDATMVENLNLGGRKDTTVSAVDKSDANNTVNIDAAKDEVCNLSSSCEFQYRENQESKSIYEVASDAKISTGEDDSKLENEDGMKVQVVDTTDRKDESGDVMMHEAQTAGEQAAYGILKSDVVLKSAMNLDTGGEGNKNDVDGHEKYLLKTGMGHESCHKSTMDLDTGGEGDKCDVDRHEKDLIKTGTGHESSNKGDHSLKQESRAGTKSGENSSQMELKSIMKNKAKDISRVADCLAEGTETHNGDIEDGGFLQRSKKRVRFEPGVKGDDGHQAGSKSFPMTLMSQNRSSQLRNDRVPDYVKNPSKYIHYTLDWSNEDNETTNSQAINDLFSLVKRSSAASMNEEVNLQPPNSVTFIPKKRPTAEKLEDCQDPSIQSQDIRDSSANAKESRVQTIAIAASQETEPDFAGNDSNDTELQQSQVVDGIATSRKGSRQYRVKAKENEETGD